MTAQVPTRPSNLLSRSEEGADSSRSLVVAVLTFRRPEELQQNLTAVSQQVAEVRKEFANIASISVLVIDNDPAQSARPVVEEKFPLVRYVWEPAPGISAARNRALVESSFTDLLVFIDDDEVPQESWLHHLLGTWNASGAAAVPGRVIPRYQSPPDSWILAGRFFDRPKRVNGARMASAAAGNLLLDLRQVREAGFIFEEPFGATGGEDSLLSRRLVNAGYAIVWCEDSVVEDLVPTTRLTRPWVLQRAYSHGNIHALIDFYLVTGWAAVVKARARRTVAAGYYICRGGSRSAFGYAVRSEALQADGLRSLCRGLGMLAGVMGVVYQQYARTEPNAQGK